MQLHSFTLQITEAQETLAFYTDVLGFTLFDTLSTTNATIYKLGFEHTGSYLLLAESTSTEPYQEVASDSYWKYSIFVNDIEKNYQEIRQKGYEIGQPYQFGDIGYLSHTKDSENHVVEFIQKSFQQNKILDTPQKNVLGLLTLRTKDPLKIIRFYEDIFELKLFVRMYVNRGKGFSLFFLGSKNLKAPSPDIDAIENRKWMYQQNHLFIEIQHYWNSEYDEEFELTTPKNGLQKVNFIGDLTSLKQRLIDHQIEFQEVENSISIETIDRYSIEVTAK